MASEHQRIASIAVLRALGGLGDMLCAVPALRALRQMHGTANITLIGQASSTWLLDRFPTYIDRFAEFPGWLGLPERSVGHDQVERFVERMRAERFDLVVQLHGSGTLTNAVAGTLGARMMAGYVPRGSMQHIQGIFAPYPDDLPEVHRCLELVRLLGGTADDDALEFPVTARDRLGASGLLAPWGHSVGQYVCVHPGSGIGRRRWPAERFAQVADGLARDGLRVVLTGGPAERSLAQGVTAWMRTEAINLAGKTNLGTLAALFSGAHAVVCNDTGPSQLADALGVPTVVVFPAARGAAPADPRRWAPLDRRLHRVFHECATGGCGDGIVCEAEVTSGMVLSAARQLLAVEAPSAA